MSDDPTDPFRAQPEPRTQRMARPAQPTERFEHLTERFAPPTAELAPPTEQFAAPTEKLARPTDPHAEYRRQADLFFAGQSAPRIAPAAPPQPPAGPLIFDLRPWHALWGVSVLCLLAALFSDSMFGWMLLAVAFGVGGWWAMRKRVGWPPDVRETLTRRRLAPPTPAGAQPPAAPPIPFRPMTVSELFTGSLRIMARNWPTLVGIPVALLFGVVLVVYAFAMAIGHFVFDTASSLAGGSLLSGDLMSNMMILYVVFLVVIAAIGLPADALLIALSVSATEDAVRGRGIRFGAVLRRARRRIFAVCRLTLVFYAVIFLTDIVMMFAVGAAVMAGAPEMLNYLALVAALGVFAFGVLFSLSPIVLVVEGRGVFDSLRRSATMSKPAWGRILGIHLLWVVCVFPLVFGGFFVGFNVLYFALALGVMIAWVRVLQVLVYTDLRMRQEHYEQQLIAEWTQNTGRMPL
ncbi:hypothetical protein [Mycolicibacterium brumae]|uniref:Uncharacterized protein n=1 Tax=Mycolicibacterium brumae TaxID=85968 RepID=A0A2G5PHH1_9MYCO|nr:hypothetical protein [Mycolicibacterium brumae]MCV7192575.1 hypothetical protein [Mycolicibacterium brumae]PIB77434.1 hypothetical protein CQY22_000190 [Mycolicibacterium brumae]UWW10345.1 hypothetical protein L2Z93_003474 [Mycolicibacterium brumae]